jgi:glycerol kinase
LKDVMAPHILVID